MYLLSRRGMDSTMGGNYLDLCLLQFQFVIMSLVAPLWIVRFLLEEDGCDYSFGRLETFDTKEKAELWLKEARKNPQQEVCKVFPAFKGPFEADRFSIWQEPKRRT